MTNTSIASPPPKKRRGWLRTLAWLVALLLILVIVAYFVVTSPAFIKGVVLPRLGDAIHANVTVSDVSFTPSRQIILRNLKVQAKGQAPVLTVPELNVRYHLRDILGGNLHVDEIALVSPTVELVENPDGSSNLDPLLKALSGKPSKAGKPKPAKPSKPPQIDLGRLALSNASIVKIKNYAGDRRDLLELTNLNVTLSNLKNGQTAALQLSSALRVENNPPDGKNGFLAAAIKGDFHFALAADLKPASASGAAHLDVASAGGVFQDFSTFSATLNCDMTPTEIQQLLLHFQNGGVPLGDLAVSGPLDLEKMEGRLQVKLQGVDRRLLNLAGAASGIDFGTTTLNSTNEITLAKAGMIITATGRFNADKVQVTRAGLTTPTLDLSAGYDVTVDRTAQNALLQELTLAGTQDGNPLLEVHLTRPMNVAWGTGANEVGESALDLTVTNLNLADWKPFLGGNAPGGNVNLQAQLLSQQQGRQLTFDVNSQIADFTATLGGNRTVQVAVSLQARGQAVDFKQLNLSEYRLQVSRQNQQLFSVSGAGAYDLTNASADAQVTLQASLAGLASAFPQPGASVSSGRVELTGQVTQKQNTQTVTGRLVLADFTGQLGQNSFHNFGSTMDVDVSRTPEQIQIKKLTGALTQSGNAGGNFDLTGSYDLARQSAQLTAGLMGLNQDGLRPFLEPLLAGKKLVSIAINGNASVQYDPDRSSAIKADLQVANLVVNDSHGQFPATPLAAKLQIDTTLQKQAADIRQFQIGLTPTSRAQNQVQLQGDVDFSQPKAIKGSLKLLSDSLDLTSYYDLFAGGTNAGAKPPPATASQPQPASTASQEPPAVTFPLQNFTVAANIGRLYLREIVITNFQTTVKVDGGHVSVKPFQLVLNSAPVNAAADLDLSVPGYKYSFALDADQVPFAPLVNTFMPDRKGDLAGRLTAHTQISGAGITAANWQKNLAGQFNFGVTNLELSINNVHSSILRSLLNVVATIPQLVSNPESGIISIFGQLTGQRSGLLNQFQEAPIEVIAAQGRAGGGQINLQQATVQSAAFEADGQGSIMLAPVLTNSTINIPITISVSQPIAKQLNLASGNNSAGATYAPLPQFLTMTGTLGDPKTQIKKTALVGLTVKSLGSGLLNQVTNSSSPVRSLLNQFLQHAR
ncbi:MAG: AsmA family protein [Verrucomicrobiota bacterium]